VYKKDTHGVEYNNDDEPPGLLLEDDTTTMDDEIPGVSRKITRVHSDTAGVDREMTGVDS
jgi:hypothetical protein